MNLISASGISKSFTEKWLFRSISFGLAKGEKIALVGSNGTGKSTLLKVICGLIEPDGGEIASKKGISIGYLPQEPELEGHLRIDESIFSEKNPILNLVRQYETAISDPDFPADKMQILLEEMDKHKAWDFEQKASQILSRLGIHDTSRLNSELSGGQRKRVALAQILIRQPDVLILDEPTNHLDLEAIEWLENLLTDHNISLFMVTHDRYFLDNVAGKIFELDRGNLYVHNGNYAFYLENKSQRDAVMAAEVSKARNLLTKELEWMRRMPKARGTKSKSRIEAFYDLKEKAGTDLQRKEIEISVRRSRLGNKIIEAEGIDFAYGETKILNNFSYIFKKRDRIGIVGRNGIGKSTLLDILTGTLKPDAGEVVHGSTLKIGFYTQHTNNLNNDNRIIEEVKEIAEYVTLGNGEQVSVSKLLDMFLFPPSVQHTPVSKLSGGERRRLQLLKVLVSNPNFLILDEPTNDLDIDTLNILEEFLTLFDGCLVLVSHDRYFMDKLAEHLFVFEENGHIRDFYGNYTDYRDESEPESKQAETVKQSEPSTQVSSPKKKLSFKEQRELESLEKELEMLEHRKSELNQQLLSGSNSHEDLLKWSKEIEEIEHTINGKSDRWLELSEI